MAEEVKQEVTKNGGGFDFKIIIVGLVILMAAMIGSYFIAKSVMAPLMPKEEETVSETEMGEPIDVGEFTVNIASVDGAPHFLKTKVLVSISDPEASGGGEGGGKSPYLTVMQDSIVSVLREQSYEELQDPKQVDKLKEEIQKKLNKPLKGKVKEVYITVFIVQ
ncbi:MAG: flagellar basal body-associated protein FliL [Solirubrobacterales bacterium]